ncbi:MAG: nucleotidyl transferase AbiEii/AbiGii toxin family protein [Chitinispirillaceae bacterium]|nr:nucleotidyl transferase AbiEii/AbiGii toxin family protein [Chitinispirillaceae bacterium]
MKNALDQLFDEYQKRNNGSVQQTIAELIQLIALLGLSRTDFFAKAAFYGGTALRIVYGLDRFSEDLDFSLRAPLSGFTLDSYISGIREELASFGFVTEVTMREKKVITPIESAFIKATTRQVLIETFLEPQLARQLHSEEVTKVKLEIDTDPPPEAGFEVRYVDDPVPFSIAIYDPASLFAGKMAAVLARSWNNRVKGRDWYDLVFFVRKNIPLNLRHLEARLRQIKFYTKIEPLDDKSFLGILSERIKTVNFTQIKEDVERFVRDPRELDVWSKEFFLHVAGKIQCKL